MVKAYKTYILYYEKKNLMSYYEFMTS